MGRAVDSRGYVKLWRRILDNEFLAKDNNAYLVFSKLLLLVNRRTGSYSTGRFMFAKIVGLKPITTYRVLKRLENAKMVTLSSNNRFTVISICKWSEYQSDDDNQVNNAVTTGEQPGNTKQEATNVAREERRKNNTIQSAPRPVSHAADIQEIFDFYLKSFGTTGKLSPQRATKLRLRLKDAGKEMLFQAITNTANSPFHRGDNDRGWKANLDWIIRSYEQVEKMASIADTTNQVSLKELLKNVEI